MRTVLIAVLTLLLGAGPVLAQARSAYDWRTGNSYLESRGSDGSTTVWGSNSRTGSHWNTTIRPNGDMTGRDSRGDFWRYDGNTGNYWNTRGRMCFGKGLSRTCY